MEELRIFNKDTEFVIAGNKSDLNNFDIDREEIQNFASMNKIENFYTSAKTGDGINEMFKTIFENLANKSTIYGTQKKSKLMVSDDARDNKSKGCC